MVHCHEERSRLFRSSLPNFFGVELDATTPTIVAGGWVDGTRSWILLGGVDRYSRNTNFPVGALEAWLEVDLCFL